MCFLLWDSFAQSWIEAGLSAWMASDLELLLLPRLSCWKSLTDLTLQESELENKLDGETASDSENKSEAAPAPSVDDTPKVLNRALSHLSSRYQDAKMLLSVRGFFSCGQLWIGFTWWTILPTASTSFSCHVTLCFKNSPSWVLTQEHTWPCAKIRMRDLFPQWPHPGTDTKLVSLLPAQCRRHNMLRLVHSLTCAVNVTSCGLFGNHHEAKRALYSLWSQVGSALGEKQAAGGFRLFEPYSLSGIV